MTHQLFLTVDLGFGDAGKGSIIDYLTRQTDAHTVVRFCGGAQAGHRVVTPDPTRRAHVFSQFGAGTLAGARTHLSRFMLIEPFAMQGEALHLQQLGVKRPFDQLTIDAACRITTPFHRATNRLKELARGKNRHGSCGMGIGETMADAVAFPDRALRIADLTEPDRLYNRLAFLQGRNYQKIISLLPKLPENETVAAETAVFTDPHFIDWLMDEYQQFAQMIQIVPGAYLHDRLRQPGTVLFEAAQGVLLDEWYGFHPHTTWATTTLANAETLVREANYTGQVTRLGLTRAVMPRHGAGPLVTEDGSLTQALPDAVNGYDDWQQGFRLGWLDLVLLRYARAVAGQLDALVVNHLDRLAELESVQVCDSYLVDGVLLSDLPIKTDLEDLDFQANLSRLLNRARPNLTAVSTPDALLNQLSQALELPIGIVSWGETAVDKLLYEPTALLQQAVGAANGG